MNTPKKRPGALWMFFYGCPRRGFPWLLAGVLVAVLVLALLFALPGGPGVSWTIAAALFALLVVGALVFAVLAVVRPRRPRWAIRTAAAPAPTPLPMLTTTSPVEHHSSIAVSAP